MVKEFKDKFGNVFTPGKLSDKINESISNKDFSKSKLSYLLCLISKENFGSFSLATTNKTENPSVL